LAFFHGSSRDQAIIAQWLESFEKFLPRAKPVSDAMEMITKTSPQGQ
jgi:hypothetical protein